MSTKEEARSMASEIIADITATMIITRDSLIQTRNQLDREIKRIEDKMDKETIERITEGM